MKKSLKELVKIIKREKQKQQNWMIFTPKEGPKRYQAKFCEKKNKKNIKLNVL